ncbi:MAG: hypothetical protein BWY52_01557 [Chloroflexi bacterium ADurb.Bin325]|nr:MAG: hypothetical protein BWY52_01557 [Chloroflexi bacterium ADurb.Bin325]
MNAVMTMVSGFPPGITEKLGYYVYLLIDPEANTVFYVGKGTGNRIFAHLNAALTMPTASDKLDRIRGIQAKGLTVEHVVLRHGLSEKEAFEVEAALIDFIGIDDLANKVQGYAADDRGRMTIAEVIAKYRAPSVTISEPVLLITVNRLYRDGMNAQELYEITRGDWVIGSRRNKAKYAFAVYRGIIRAVYQIDHWEPVTTRYAEQRIRQRWRFEGQVAQALCHYVGGSTENYAAVGAQNPIRYVNC